MLLGATVVFSGTFVSCSDDDDPDYKKPGEDYQTVTIGFKNAEKSLFGGPTSYGANLYYGANDQVTTGYLTQIYGDTYAQFSINYGQTFDNAFNPVWGYSYYEGGLALSNWHDMTVASYENQLSVYDTTSPSGGNFVVANGYSSVTNPANATLADYAGCAKVYITDSQGYTVKNPGAENSAVSGNDKEAYFESVYINNTTYTYLTMLNGGPYASALNSSNKGWFKVQFIAFEDNDPTDKPVGYVEAYLANFDESLAGGYEGIVNEWIQVDLSSLPETSILVINFVGSDSGEYGLNTPGYCALDNFEISVEK